MHIEDIRNAIRVESSDPPATTSEIAEVSTELQVPFPKWLSDAYLACNGFRGPTSVSYLWPLVGEGSVISYNHFFRGEDYFPQWLHRAIMFGDDGVGGTYGALDGRLIYWYAGDGDDYKVLEPDLLVLWRRKQAMWDEIADDRSR